MTEFTKQGTSGKSIMVVDGLDAAQIGKLITDNVMDRLLDEQTKRPFVLGIPTGATPMSFLNAFVDAAKSLPVAQKEMLGSRLHVVVMDDFLDPVTKQNIDPSIPQSAVGFMQKNLFEPLAAVIGPLDLSSRLLYPRAGQVGYLRDQVINLGGIDMQIMATDPYEGYVAQHFPNEPYEKTEAAKSGSFSKGFLQHHPWAANWHGVTFDLNDFGKMISANPSGVFELVILGSAKKQTLDRFLSAGKYLPEMPISFLWDFADRTTVYTDQTCG